MAIDRRTSPASSRPGARRWCGDPATGRRESRQAPTIRRPTAVRGAARCDGRVDECVQAWSCSSCSRCCRCQHQDRSHVDNVNTRPYHRSHGPSAARPVRLPQAADRYHHGDLAGRSSRRRSRTIQDRGTTVTLRGVGGSSAFREPPSTAISPTSRRCSRRWRARGFAAPAGNLTRSGSAAADGREGFAAMGVAYVGFAVAPSIPLPGDVRRASRRRGGAIRSSTDEGPACVSGAGRRAGRATRGGLVPRTTRCSLARSSGRSCTASPCSPSTGSIRPKDGRAPRRRPSFANERLREAPAAPGFVVVRTRFWQSTALAGVSRLGSVVHGAALLARMRMMGARHRGDRSRGFGGREPRPCGRSGSPSLPSRRSTRPSLTPVTCAAAATGAIARSILDEVAMTPLLQGLGRSTLPGFTTNAVRDSVLDSRLSGHDRTLDNDGDPMLARERLLDVCGRGSDSHAENAALRATEWPIHPLFNAYWRRSETDIASG